MRQEFTSSDRDTDLLAKWSPSVGPERPYCLERDSEFRWATCWALMAFKTKSKRPVCWTGSQWSRWSRRRSWQSVRVHVGTSIEERVTHWGKGQWKKFPFLGLDLSKFRFGRIKDGSGQILSRNTCNIRLENWTAFNPQLFVGLFYTTYRSNQLICRNSRFPLNSCGSFWQTKQKIYWLDWLLICLHNVHL